MGSTSTAQRKSHPGVLSAGEVMACTSVSHRELVYWCRCGYILPANEGLGNGFWRWFDPVEVACVRATARLATLGFLAGGPVAEAVRGAIRSTPTLVGMVVAVRNGHPWVLTTAEAVALLDSGTLGTCTLIDGDRLVA